MDNLVENQNNFWDEEYLKGSMLNKYPFNYLVQIVMKYFGNIEDKSTLNALEVGCGSGANLYFLATEGFNVNGFDLSEHAINYAKHRFNANNLKYNLEVSGFEYLKNYTEEFDLIIERAVFYTQSFEYLKNEIFPNIKKSLKRDGIFISYFFTDSHPDKEFLKTMDLVFTPTKEEILDLFSIFEIEFVTENKLTNVYGSSVLGEKDEYIIVVRKKHD